MRSSEDPINPVDQSVEEWVTSLTPKRDKVLVDLEKDAERRSLSTIGPMVARIITLLLQCTKCERALEVGTSIGYSGIWIARSLQGSKRKLTTIELDPQRCKEAQVNFRKAGVEKYVELREGDARNLFPTIAKRNPRSFDLIFLDVGDKAVYVDLLKPCLNALRTGGFLIADNTLWGWSTATTTEKRHQTLITAVSKFHKAVFTDRRLDATIVPLRTADSLPYGFTVCHKRRD